MTTEVSIIMPVYNTGEILRIAVDSVLKQTFKNWELLLIDDGSNDESPIICDNYAARDSRIKVYHKSNGGICDARNYGIAKAIGKYVAFCDHDDEYHPLLLEETIAALKNSNADFAKFRYKEINNNKVAYILPQWEETLYYSDNVCDIILKLISKGYFSTIWSCVYKRDMLMKAKVLFDTSFKHGGEDFDFNIRMFSSINSIVLLPDILYTHYVRDALSTSAKIYEDVFIKTNNQIISVNKLIENRNLKLTNYLDCYCDIILEKILFIIPYGIRLNLNKEDIINSIEELYQNCIMLPTCKNCIHNNFIIYWIFKNRFFYILYNIGRVKIKLKKYLHYVSLHFYMKKLFRKR